MRLTRNRESSSIIDKLARGLHHAIAVPLRLRQNVAPRSRFVHNGSLDVLAGTCDDWRSLAIGPSAMVIGAN